MGFFDKLFGSFENGLPKVHLEDSDIAAPADGTIIDVKTLPDPVFAGEVLGKSVAFHHDGDSAVICAPANGVIRQLFPTGHAFQIETKEGVWIMVHVGIDTVNEKGSGFKLYGKRKGDAVSAGDPIVKVDLAKLSEKYDMSTILVITEDNGKAFDFLEAGRVQRGQSILKKNA